MAALFMKLLRVAIVSVSLFFLCSCVSHPVFKRPGDLEMNKEAGRGGVLIVPVQIKEKDGEELPFVIDTGCPVTILDKSLQTMLGWHIRSVRVHNFGDQGKVKIYWAPDLYLEDCQLAKFGDFVATADLRSLSATSDHPIKGILGMDVLCNYCIQLDFAAHKIRFLDDSIPDKSGWGRPFRLLSDEDGCLIMIDTNLVGVPGPGSAIDTGYNTDGWLVPELFKQWTNNMLGRTNNHALFPNVTLGGDVYSNIDLSELDPPSARVLSQNGIGLHFLSMHLVTLDFPHKTFYLKRTSVAPLPIEDIFNTDANSPSGFLYHLKKSGQLPGCSKDEHGELTIHILKNEYALQKNNDSSIYHYQVVQSSDGWKLQRAWRTDANGKILQEYPIPPNK
jgi:Aspartyl protease